MNEADEYDFCSAENSSLSSLFGKETSFEIGNSSLVYKAPKQPVNVKNKELRDETKFFYKYINLYELAGQIQQKLGKHIVGLMSSETNVCDILIYQTKKNILVRRPINTISVCIHGGSNSCLNLLEYNKKWLLEFFSNEDCLQFRAEFSKCGGVIQSTSVDHNQSTEDISVQKKAHFPPELELSNLKDSVSISPMIGTMERKSNSINSSSTDNSNAGDIESEKEKTNILARLAKMGLPQLPSLQKEVENKSYFNAIEISEENHSKEENIRKLSNNTHENKKQYNIEDNQQLVKSENNIVLVTPGSGNGLQKNNYILSQSDGQIQLLAQKSEVDRISLMFTENQLNNAELRHHMYLLTSKLNEITECKKSVEDKAYNQLKSKLRAYHLKIENLEAELKKSEKRCLQMEKTNTELISEINQKIQSKNDSFSQTSDFLSNSETDHGVNKSEMKDLLNLIQCIPLNSEEDNLTQLNRIKKYIDDGEIVSSMERCVNFLQEFCGTRKSQLNNDVNEMRSSFVQKTKKIMYDMYSNVGSSFEEKNDFKKVFTEQIRNATSEIIRNYDDSILNINGKHNFS